MASKHRSWKRRLSFTIVILFALYVLFGFAGLPLLVRHVGLKKANELLDGSVSVGSIRSNPFTWSLTLRDIDVRTPDGQPLFQAARFHGDFAFWSLFGKGWRFEEILLNQPLAHLSVDKEGRLNAAALLKTRDAQPEEASAQESAPFAIPLIKIDSLRVEDGGLDLQIDMPDLQFSRKVEALSFELKDFSTHPNSSNPYAFSAQTSAGESSSVKGQLQLNPLSTNGTVRVENINLADYDVFAADAIGFDLTGGKLSFAVDYLFSPVSEPRGLSWSNGNISLRDLALEGRGSREPILTLGQMEIAGLVVDLLKGSVHLDKFGLERGVLYVSRNKGEPFNLLRDLLPRPAAAATDTAAASTTATAANNEIRLGVLANDQDIGVALTFVINQIHHLLSERWQVSVGEIAVADNRIEYADRFLEKEVAFAIDAISLSGTNVRNFGSEAFTLQLAGKPWGGSASLSSEITPEPTALSFAYEAASIDLSRFAPYLPLTPETDVRSIALTSSGKGTATLAGSPLPQASVQFGGRLGDIRITQTGSDKAVIAAESVSLDSAKASTNPLALHARRLEINAPSLAIVRDAQEQINLLKMLPQLQAQAAEPQSQQPAQTQAAQPAKAQAETARTDAPAADADATAATPATAATSATAPATTTASSAATPDINLENFVIDEFVILGGRVSVEDDSVKPATAFAINNAAFALKPVVLKADTRSTFEASASLADGAAGGIAASGSVILLDPLRSLRLDLATEAVTLTPFAGYAAQMVGRPFEQGKLDAKLGYSIENSRLKGDNDVKMHQLDFGPRQPGSDAPNLPLDLGMAILTDRSGTMHLDIPVSGDLNDPGFSLASVIQYAIVNVIEKLVASPFSALGSLFGSGTQQPATEVVFAPGSAEIPQAAIAPLALLADALSQRPALILTLNTPPLAAADAAALREQLLQQRLEAYAAERGISVTQAVERLYDEANEALGVTPKREPVTAPAPAIAAEAADAATANAQPAAEAAQATDAAQAANAEPQLQVRNIKRATVRTARHGYVPYFNVQHTQTLVPVEAQAQPQPEAPADATAGQTTATAVANSANANSTNAATDAQAASNTAASAANATDATSASTQAAQTAQAAPAKAVADEPVELTPGQKRAVLLAQTQVPAASADALTTARKQAVTAALTGNSTNPLPAERIHSAAEAKAQPDKEPAPVVWFELGAKPE